MILGFLKDKVVVILATLVMVSLLVNAVMTIIIHFKEQNIITLNTKLLQIEAVSKVKEAEHLKRVKSYDEAMEEIGRYYAGVSVEVDNFVKDDNETECESATRLFRGFKY